MQTATLTSARPFQADIPEPRRQATLTGRPRSPLRMVGALGQDRGGVVLTDLDLARLRRLARWYCLTPEHLARAEEMEARLSGAAPDQSSFPARVLSIKRRLARLDRIIETGSHAGSPVGSAVLGHHKTGWFCSPYGATAAGAPWRLLSTISPVLAHHAFSAADIGLQIESLRIPAGPPNGFRVLAEREIRTRVDQFGNDVTPDIESKHRTDTGAINKSPDLAILDHTGGNYIGIEVERDPRRPLKSYRDKLSAYEKNPAVLAVWYLCDTQAVANRVGRAATQIFGKDSGFPLRIRVLAHQPAFVEIPNLNRDANLLADLARLVPKEA